MNHTSLTPKLFTLLKNGYSLSDFKADLVAGLTVAIVALPLAMALGIASGATPDKGLVTAVIAGALISFLGGSRVQIGGPTGAFVVVIFNVIAQHGYDGLILATIMAGVILLIAGYARFGQSIKFIPHPVVIGFTSGIAVIIATSQVKDFLGLQIASVPAEFIPKWQTYFHHMSTMNLATLIVGGLSLIIILAFRRYAPKLPGYLIAVVLAALLVQGLHLDVATIGSRFTDIPTGLPMPSWPVWSFAKAQEVLPSAFTIAFLAGIEALLSAMVADGMTGYRHRSDQELVGQGVANIASALFGGLPATGAIARTATNIKAGARTPFAGIFHALFVLLFMLFGMDIIKFVPMTALAAILFVVAWGMSEAHHFVRLFSLSTQGRVVLVVTFLLTILVDLTVAIGVGVIVASLLFMHEMSKAVELSTGGRRKPLPANIADKLDAEAEAEPDDETQRRDLPEGVEVFRINGPLFFGVASDLIDTLKAMGQMPKVLIVRMSRVPYLDPTGATAMEELVKECHRHHTQVIFSGSKTQPRELLNKLGVHGERDGVSFANNFEDAVNGARNFLTIPK